MYAFIEFQSCIGKTNYSLHISKYFHIISCIKLMTHIKFTKNELSKPKTSLGFLNQTSP